MNLTIDRAPALSALARASGVVNRGLNIPIIGNIALSGDGETLTIRATDLEMEVVEVVPASISATGQITVPADKLHDIVRNADAGSQLAILTETGDPRVRVKSGRSNFRLPALPAVSFPVFSTDGLDEGFAVPAAVLSDMISRVLWSIDTSDKNTIKGCVYLNVHEGELHAVGACTNGVALRRTEAPAGSDIHAILPGKVAQYIARWLADAEGDALVRSAEGKIQIVHGGSTYTSKLFDMPNYFNYAGNIHETHDLTARVAQDELATALRRVMIMADGRAGTLRLAFTDGQLSIRARGDSSGEGVEEIGAEYEGPEAVVLIKGSQLVSALGAMKGDILEFGFATVAEDKNHKTGLLVLRAPCDAGLVCNLMQPKA